MWHFVVVGCREVCLDATFHVARKSGVVTITKDQAGVEIVPGHKKIGNTAFDLCDGRGSSPLP